MYLIIIVLAQWKSVLAAKLRLSFGIVYDFIYLSLSCLPKNYIFAKDRDFWGVG